MRSKRHILFLETNDAIGGVVRVHEYLIGAFDTSAFRVTLACQRDGPLDVATRDRQDIERVPLDFGTKRPTRAPPPRPALRNIASLAGFVHSIRRLAPYCRREGVDLIYTSDKKRAVVLALALSYATGRPFAYHIHNVYVDYRMNRLALRRASAIIANSHASKADFIRTLGPEMERIRVVHNGVDPAVFRPLPTPRLLRDEFQVRENALLVGVATRLSPEKGHPTLIEAVARVLKERPGSLHLLFLGDDRISSGAEAYSEDLRAQIRRLGMDAAVTFAGYQADMATIYNGLDVVVDPAWEEAFGMVVIEPMACGRLVVGTRAGGIPEIIEDGTNGFLFPPRDAAALAERLRRILDMSATEAERLRHAARQTVLDRFTISRQTRAIEAVFEEAADSPRGDGEAAGKQRDAAPV